MVLSTWCDALLACCRSDGIRILDPSHDHALATTIPVAHLSSSCASILWLKTTVKNRRKSEVKGTRGLCLGLADGSVVIYDTAKGELSTKLKAHTTSLQSLCSTDTELYGGSKDGHIVSIDLSSFRVQRSWKCDANPVTAMAVTKDKRHLLSAYTEVKLWVIESQQCVKIFTGHITPVFFLDFVYDSAEISYFVSAATDDRVISAWKADYRDDKRKVKKPVCTYALSDEPLQVFASHVTAKDESVKLVCCTKSGKLEAFCQYLNGHVKKPCMPNVSCNVVGDDASETPLPILSACVSNNDSQALFLYGSIVKPAFERIEVEGAKEKVLKLVRPEPFKTKPLHQQDSVTKTEKPIIDSSQVKYLLPEHLSSAGVQHSSAAAGSSAQKRALKELSMEERLQELMLHQRDKDKPRSSKDPSSDDSNSLAILLVQGLHSHDAKIIEGVLSNANQETINRVIKLLPLNTIVPFLEEIGKRLRTKSRSNPYIQWFQSLLECHMAYLSSHPQISALLSCQYQLMESRLLLLDKLLRLQGKLSVLLSKAKSQDNGESYSAQDAKLTFEEHSDSSDVEEVEDGLDEMDLDGFYPSDGAEEGLLSVGSEGESTSENESSGESSSSSEGEDNTEEVPSRALDRRKKRRQSLTDKTDSSSDEASNLWDKSFGMDEMEIEEFGNEATKSKSTGGLKEEKKSLKRRRRSSANKRSISEPDDEDTE